MADLSIHCATVGAIRHLAHELRQPLSGIESIAYYLELILPDADETVREQFDKLRQMIQQANWILQDSVQAARLCSPTPESIDLKKALARLAAETVAREEIHLQLHMDDVLPLVRFDACQALSVLQSLFDFFRFASPGGEPVRIHAAGCPSGVTVGVSAVSDRIDGAAFHRLLDPRPRSDLDDQEIPAGSVRRLIEANGGSLHLEATCEGQLTVEVFFPAA